RSCQLTCAWVLPSDTSHKPIISSNCCLSGILRFLCFNQKRNTCACWALENNRNTGKEIQSPHRLILLTLSTCLQLSKYSCAKASTISVCSASSSALRKIDVATLGHRSRRRGKILWRRKLREKCSFWFLSSSTHCKSCSLA